MTTDEGCSVGMAQSRSSHLFQDFYKYKREDEVNGQIPPFK